MASLKPLLPSAHTPSSAASFSPTFHAHTRQRPPASALSSLFRLRNLNARRTLFLFTVGALCWVLLLSAQPRSDGGRTDAKVAPLAVDVAGLSHVSPTDDANSDSTVRPPPSDASLRKSMVASLKDKLSHLAGLSPWAEPSSPGAPMPSPLSDLISPMSPPASSPSNNPHGAFPTLHFSLQSIRDVISADSLRLDDPWDGPLPTDARLSERLGRLKAIGLPSSAGGKGDLQPPDWVQKNLQTCNHVQPNHNKDLTLKSYELWSSFNTTAIADLRMSMVRFLQDLVTDGILADDGGFGPQWRSARSKVEKTPGGLESGRPHGRGLVFTAGNADTISRVLLTLRILRKHHHCTLPAEIFHFPGEAPPKGDPVYNDLAAVQATLVELGGTKKSDKRTKNWHLKARAIIESSWEEALYLDSDSMPSHDPEYLFDAPGYKRLGALFWPDYWKTQPTNPIWQIIGVHCRDEWEQEAGQVVVDKRRHLDALYAAHFMLLDWKLWYHFSDGDKDTFRFAFLALAKRWATPGRYVSAGALPRGTLSGDFCSHTMLQNDHLGEPLFVHYNLLKQITSGVGRGFSWGRHKYLPDFHDPPPLAALPPPSGGDRGTGHAGGEKGVSAASAQKVAAQALHASEQGDGSEGIHDVDADQLANAGFDGKAIKPAARDVRRRAVMERGLRPYFHGGIVSALCIDFGWEDPRTEGEEEEQEQEKAKPLPIVDDDLHLDFEQNPLEIAQWSDNIHLINFEPNFYDEGGKPSGKGFY